MCNGPAAMAHIMVILLDKQVKEIVGLEHFVHVDNVI
jgi:hypothetical protein